MSEPLTYMVRREWTPPMLERAELIAKQASDNPETQLLVLGALTKAWPQIIDACIQSEFGCLPKPSMQRTDTQ